MYQPLVFNTGPFVWILSFNVTFKTFENASGNFRKKSTVRACSTFYEDVMAIIPRNVSGVMNMQVQN